MDENEIRWYVVGSVTRDCELKIRDELRRDEHECFVPLKYELKGKQGNRRRILVPAISGLIFVRGTLAGVREAIRYRRSGLFIRKSTFSNNEDYLSVSEHDMRNFMMFSDLAGERITYYSLDEIRLQAGDKIRITGGFYDGCEGVVLRVKGKRHRQLVVSIPNLIYAAVELKPELLQLVPSEAKKSTVNETQKMPQKNERSKNFVEDKKLLFDYAKRLLFEIPTPYQHEKEYYLLFSEMRRIRERLLPFKGYVAAQEAELALPLYLSAVKLEEDVEASEQRLRKAMNRLQDTSILKLRIRLYLAQLAGDEMCRRIVKEQVAFWKGTRLSPHQKEFISECKLVFTRSQEA